jgi:outer membrane lipoprotein carrier protein
MRATRLFAASAAALLMIAPLGAPLSAQAPDAMLKRASAAYAKARTVFATFERTLTNPLTGTTVVSRGELRAAPGGKLAVNFTDPKNDRVVSDGSVLWAYMPSTNPGQVIKMPLGTSGAIGGVDLVSQLLTDPASKYTSTAAGSATVSGRATHAIALVPKKPMQFSAATVWIDDVDATLRQFEATDANGLVQRVRFVTVRKNVAAPKDAFTFTPPAGVHVVDQAALFGGR